MQISMSVKKRGDIRIGISGWRYAPWRGEFYPEKLPQRRELAFAADCFRTIEINGTFYSLQRPESFERWYEETPDDFVFAVKGHRFITHVRRLEDPATTLANFFASGVLRLGKKLGPFLWQFPPSFRYDAQRFERFFRKLPRNAQQAARLARSRETWMKGRSAFASPEPPELRHAVEVRHASFEDAGFIEQLREHNIAVVVADTAGKWPLIEDPTADFVYVRLHGDKEIYVSGYSGEAIRSWCRKVKRWSEGGVPAGSRLIAGRPAKVAERDVFVYFDNDVKVRAPFDARKLEECAGVGRRPENQT